MSIDDDRALKMESMARARKSDPNRGKTFVTPDAVTSKKYVELGRQFAHEQIKTVTGQAAVYLFAAWLDERSRDETSSPPRELLERVAWEHKDTNKFQRARDQLQAWLRSSEKTNAPRQRFHQNCPTCSCKEPADSGA